MQGEIISLGQHQTGWGTRAVQDMDHNLFADAATESVVNGKRKLRWRLLLDHNTTGTSRMTSQCNPPRTSASR